MHISSTGIRWKTACWVFLQPARCDSSRKTPGRKMTACSGPRSGCCPEPPACLVPEAYSVLSDVLGRFMEKVAHQYPDYTPDHLQDAVWVGYRLVRTPAAGRHRETAFAGTDGSAGTPAEPGGNPAPVSVGLRRANQQQVLTDPFLIQALQGLTQRLEVAWVNGGRPPVAEQSQTLNQDFFGQLTEVKHLVSWHQAHTGIPQAYGQQTPIRLQIPAQ